MSRCMNRTGKIFWQEELLKDMMVLERERKIALDRFSVPGVPNTIGVDGKGSLSLQGWYGQSWTPTNKQTNWRTNKPTSERRSKLANEQSNKRTNERTDGQTDERTNGRTNEQTDKQTTNKRQIIKQCCSPQAGKGCHKSWLPSAPLSPS